MKGTDWKRKLTSRKLWAAIAGLVTGLAMAFGLNETIVSTVAGAIVAIGSVVTYIIAEGKVDAAAVKTAVEAVQNAGEAIKRATDGESGE